MESLIDYSRQREFDNVLNLHKQQTNYIIGCGGVGFWLGLILAMHGHERFVLIDGQSIERSNLNRLPVPPTWVGINKAIALRKTIRTVRPLTSIHVVSTHITENTFDILKVNVSGYRVIWDCTDDARIQKKIFKAVGNTPHIHYRKLGYEGFKVGSYKAYDVWIPEDYAPGYRTSNACASTSAFAAIIGIMSEGLNRVSDLEINIADLIGSTSTVEVDDEEDDEDDTEDEDVDVDDDAIELPNINTPLRR